MDLFFIDVFVQYPNIYILGNISNCGNVYYMEYMHSLNFLSHAFVNIFKFQNAWWMLQQLKALPESVLF